MAFVVGDRPVRPLTADEVMRMVDAGILDEDEPVELLHGVLTAVSVKTPEHEELKMRLVRWLDSTAEGHRTPRRASPSCGSSTSRRNA